LSFITRIGLGTALVAIYLGLDKGSSNDIGIGDTTLGMYKGRQSYLDRVNRVMYLEYFPGKL
jgi:hypothetical protein